MTQKTTYECDICHGIFPQERLRGFEFHGSKLVQKCVDQVHRHYCVPCICEFVQATAKIYTEASADKTKG